MVTDSPPVDPARRWVLAERPPAWQSTLILLAFLVASFGWMIGLGVGLAVLLLAAAFVGGNAQALDPAAMGAGTMGAFTVIQFAGFGALAVLFALVLGVPLKRAFAIRVPPIAGVVGAIGVGLLVGLLPGKVAELVMRTLPALDLGNLSMINGLLAEGPLLGRIVFLFGIVVAAPIIEEVVFRGLLWDVVERGSNRWAAWVVTSLLFAFYHLDPIQVLGVVTTGFFIGWLRLWTRSLWPSIVAHAVNNGLAAGLAIGFGDAMKDAELPWWVALLSFAIACAFAAIAAAGSATAAPATDAA